MADCAGAGPAVLAAAAVVDDSRLRASAIMVSLSRAWNAERAAAGIARPIFILLVLLL